MKNIFKVIKGYRKKCKYFNEYCCQQENADKLFHYIKYCPKDCPRYIARNKKNDK